MAQVYPDHLSQADAEPAPQTVQKLDPPGIAARDLKECWLLQVPPGHPNLNALVECWVQSSAAHRVEGNHLCQPRVDESN